MMNDYVLLAYIATMLSPFLWFVQPSILVGNQSWFYRHILVVIVLLIVLGTYRYNFPLII